ncbi:MAG TPA: outer membrane beta-barrel protein [Acetobacteraceae bacterium]|nr:outer membrane beta-barrel protein [Acetobacteraceae bacterium]
MQNSKQTGAALWLAAAFVSATAPAALAQTAAPPIAPAAPPAAAAPAPAPAPAAAADQPPPGLWVNGIHFYAQLDAGIMGNPSGPNDGLNFGRLFDDHANQVQLNQLLLTANKPLDPKDPGYQWGFKAQVMYGSDARYTQFLGELNRVDPNQRYQLDIVEANILAHLPWLTSGGIDIKAGQYPTPIGYETIDPSTNPFYSHSYIFNFALPFKHTGLLAVTHVNDMLDIYSDIDTGTNTTFGPLGDNNGAIGGIGGFNLTLMGGKLTVLALTHFGPDQATRLLSGGFAAAGLPTVNANGQWRFYNDVVVTYKATDALTLVTETAFARDGFGAVGKPANAIGIAQYASYALTDTLTLNGRIEYFRDDNNFFVASYPSNNGPILAQQGFAPFVHAAPGTNSTYGEMTFGVTWKPPLPAPITGLAIRPEIRWDHAFTNNHPFNAQLDNNSVTLGVDAVLTVF